MEDSTKSFRFESETPDGIEKRGTRNKKLKIGVILIICFLLVNFVLAVVVMNRTSKSSSSFSTEDFKAAVNQTQETREIADEMKLTLDEIKNWTNSTEEKFKSHQTQIQSLSNQTKIDKELETLEEANRQLKKFQQELKEQFESLSQKFYRLKNPQPLQNCGDAMESFPAPRSKKQTIYPHGNRTSLEVVCDFETDGGGWTIIQKRTSGPKFEFDRNWTEYANGFGSLDGNFWLGLEKIRALTKNGDQELRIQLEDFEGNKRWAKYSHFSISDASDFYRLTLGGFYGNSTAGDSTVGGGYAALNGMQFSTKDKENGIFKGCAEHYHGGWWYSNCGPRSWLNGPYFPGQNTGTSNHGILWFTWKGESESLAKTEMKIRTRK